MHPAYKMYALLYCLVLLTFPYKNLHNPTLVEAKLETHGFTIDLLHRYSPNSPFYNSSMTLQERFHRLVHHSSSRYHHLKRLKNTCSSDTALIQNQGDYLMKVSIGDPPVDQFMIADSGSDLIWVQCKPCDHCYSQNYAIFNPNQSSTFGTVSCNSPFCINVPQKQCIYSDECQYSYAYGDGSTATSGIMVRDVFSFSSTNHPPNNINSSLVFGCGFAQQGDFNEYETGMVGLSPGPLSLISQLSSSIANTFSYCLTPTTSNFTSKLRLGRTHAETKQGDVTVTVPLSNKYFPEFYAVTLKAISIGQTRVEVEQDIIIDNGSTLTTLVPGTYSKLEEAVKTAISAKPMMKPIEPDLDLCYDTRPGFTAPPDIVFHFSEGDILLNSTNFLIDSGDHYVCLAIVPSEEDDDDLMILGNVAQVNFEVEFNLDSKMVSFTPTNCATVDDSG